MNEFGQEYVRRAIASGNYRKLAQYGRRGAAARAANKKAARLMKATQPQPKRPEQISLFDYSTFQGQYPD